MTQQPLPVGNANTVSLPGLNVVIVMPGFPDDTLRNVLAHAIAAGGGPLPGMKSDSESAHRLHYPPSQAKVIINTAAKRMHEVIGFHHTVIAVEVPDRVAAAQAAHDKLAEFGYESTVHTQAEPEYPDGFLTFLSVPAFMGLALMFWPRPQDVTRDIGDTLPKRLPCTPEDLAVPQAA